MGQASRWRRKRAQGGAHGEQLTIDGALELLIAGLAGELANAGLLIQLHRDGIRVIAEQAVEERR
jgi:hypothetical protein